MPAGPPVLADVVAEVYGGDSFNSRLAFSNKIAEVFKKQKTLVDVDVLALALGLDLPLFTDDYRLQNIMQSAGKATSSVESKGAKQVWRWELRCTGCRTKTEVPSDVDRSKKGAVKDCDICGSPMMLKKAR